MVKECGSLVATNYSFLVRLEGCEFQKRSKTFMHARVLFPIAARLGN